MTVGPSTSKMSVLVLPRHYLLHRLEHAVYYRIAESLPA
jgi:hypothetical protein